MKIAGDKTDKDWLSLELKIKVDFGNVDLWNQALDFFEDRLNERYIKPAEEIQDNLSALGEGFAITTLLCSLIEALETFYEGKCFKCGPPRSKYDYGNGTSRLIYVNFLTKREPFKAMFSPDLAKDFYNNVRCALLHEAMTRNGWVIRTNSEGLVEEKDGEKRLNRRVFLQEIKNYLKKYRGVVQGSKDRKDAFIRKMKCICDNS
ncbi:MAG: hypothetical protein COB30_014585 [Ectothiorhodospiraceae bacterium]|nr:hypothetical protein [Ectothiorhodospiraceae bacterium]